MRGRIGFRNPLRADGRFARTGRARYVLLTATVATLLWSVALSFVIAKVVHAVTGLRVGAEAEEQGLDLRIHGERGYNM